MAVIRPIKEFWDIPRTTDTAVLLGKGPNLDEYDPTFNPPGSFVFGLNEVALVHRCDASLYFDNGLSRLDYRRVNPDIIIFCPHRWPYEGEGTVYQYATKDIGTKWPREMWVPYTGVGTGPLAITILGLWGIEKIILWGFDRMRWLQTGPDDSQLHAKCVSRVAIGTAKDLGYENISRSILVQLKAYQIQATFMHEVSHGELCVQSAATGTL